jgi:hypothetical protein
MMTYKGGNGLDSKEAIIIVGAKDELEGIDGEYIWLEEKYGEQDFGWELIDQQSIDEGDKKYDILKIKFLNGEEREFWFDITDFYGK